MTAADAKAWYDTWYVPNNAYVVITGDVDHKEVFALAEKYYGPLEGAPCRAQAADRAGPGRHAPGQRQGAGRTAGADHGLQGAVLRDVDKDSDPYALEMLAAILDGHDAARFNKKLVREDKVALSVGIDYDATARGPGMIYLHGSPSEGRTVAELEAALRAEITRIQQEGVSEKELKRAKAQLVASQVYKLDSMFGQAMEIGQTESAGIPYQKIDRMLENCKRSAPPTCRPSPKNTSTTTR
jgi:zinc protease